MLARLTLVWFALSLAVAVAAPIVHPQSMEVICTSPGMAKLVLQSDDSGPVSDMSQWECPLCMLPFSAPPPAQMGWGLLRDLRAHALPPAAVAPYAVASAAPWWARGPPQN
jgi:hypothetical protein